MRLSDAPPRRLPPRRAGAAFALAAAAAVALGAAGCAKDRPFDVQRPPAAVPLEGRVVEIPISLSQGVVLVPTLVDGHGPFWFALDTGSTTVVVGERLSRDVDLHVEDRTGSILTEAGRTDGSMQQTTLRELRIGEARFRFVGALVADLAPLSRGVGRPLDGILGVPLLTTRLWTVDPVRGVLRIEDGALPADDTDDVLRVKMDGGLPTVRIEVAGRPMDAIVDTGQRLAISIGPDDAVPLRSGLRVIGESVGQVLDGEVRRDVARLDGDVRIGSVATLRAPPVLLGRATRVGMSAFDGRVLTFDLANLRMRVSPARR